MLRKLDWFFDGDLNEAGVLHDGDAVAFENLRQLNYQPILVFFYQHCLCLQVGWQVELVDQVLEELLRLTKHEPVERDHVPVADRVVDNWVAPIVLELEVGYAEDDSDLGVKHISQWRKAGLDELTREHVPDFHSSFIFIFNQVFVILLVIVPTDRQYPWLLQMLLTMRVCLMRFARCQQLLLLLLAISLLALVYYCCEKPSSFSRRLSTISLL